MSHHERQPWKRTCDWTSGTLECHYPVGRLDEGRSSGFCIFHRKTPDGFQAAEIARDSLTSSPEQYLARAKALVYGDGTDNANVRELRARLRKKAEIEEPEPFQIEPGALG